MSLPNSLANNLASMRLGSPQYNTIGSNNTMLKHRNITIERLEKFRQQGQFDDVNLRTLLWKQRRSDTVKLWVYSVPDLKRISFEEAMKGEYKPTSTGNWFGPGWATFWFRVNITIPNDWVDEEVQFIFDPDCEAMVWSADGHPLQGITGEDGGSRHVDYRLTKKCKGGEVFDFFIETACNGLFGQSGVNFPDNNRHYLLKTAEIAIPDKLAFSLWYDYEILIGMVRDLPGDSQISCDALYTANAIVNVVHHHDRETLKLGHQIAREFFAKRQKTGASDHNIIAIGNCHIDTAWLWPFGETKRKAARSFATQISLADEYPDYKFTHSQAQQWEWVEELYPSLFKRIKEKLSNGQIYPVGGTWVEMDTNMPSGEALCRQFLYGQRFFESRFNYRCKVFWLPDTFGYSAQLPQIIKESGLKYFFSQKLSWNNINRFPNNTFMWTGLDGTSILTHFSPADTYNAQGIVRDVAYSVSNNKDKEYSNMSLLCYGNGDGGGGPLAPMIERLKRMQAVEGLPAKVTFGPPDLFYERLEETSRDLVSWKGELYFELHRGTYTTQAKVKRGNRKSEYLLRTVELLSTLAVVNPHGTIERFENPKKELDRLWKLVLLNQFHDVLPGSSIEMVYTDALAYYDDVANSAEKLINSALDFLFKSFVHIKKAPGAPVSTQTIINLTSWPIDSAVVELEAGYIPSALQVSKSGKALAMIQNIKPMSVCNVSNVDLVGLPAKFVPVTVFEADYICDDDGSGFLQVSKIFEVSNEFITLKLDQNGRIVSLYDKINDRESIEPGKKGNLFRIFEDIPIYWDAWDVEVYHLEKGWDAILGSLTIEETGPIRVVLKAVHPITKDSSIEQRIIVTAMSPRVDFDTVIHWNENRVFLKVEFPLNVNCDYATFESQFGYIQRPTHYNNSWDMARFEVCGHKFADLSEFGYGVALLNDCKYGYATKGNVMRLSLLRSSKMPDLHADLGTHTLKYAIYPHKDAFLESDVVKVAYQFNVPPIVHPMVASANFDFAAKEFFTVSSPNVVIDTVKIAEDPRSSAGTADVILRLYEAYGGRGVTKLKTPLNVLEANLCNVLEDIHSPVEMDAEGHLLLQYSPFKLISVRLLVKV